MYPHIHNDFRNQNIEKLNEFIKGKGKRFKKLMKYFYKKWRYNKSFNFYINSENHYFRRMNNI